MRHPTGLSVRGSHPAEAGDPKLVKVLPDPTRPSRHVCSSQSASLASRQPVHELYQSYVGILYTRPDAHHAMHTMVVQGSAGRCGVERTHRVATQVRRRPLVARPAVTTADAVQYVPSPTARTLPSAARYSALDARMSRRQLSNHADSSTCVTRLHWLREW